MASRFDNRLVLNNTLDLYKNKFDERGVRAIQHYDTGHLSYPTSEEIRGINTLTHTWKRGDHYYKLSQIYYGDPTYWWVIAQYNKKPTEDKINFGDTVLIPTPLGDILDIYEGYR